MINKLKNEKGITLIALVVTIIVILILAFISLSLVLGQDGLFKKASDAGKLQKIKNTQEILEVQALSARANTVLSGENVVDEFLDIIKKDNLITDNDIDEEYGLFITVDGLEFKIEEENNNVKIIYQGEKDKLTPSIQTCIINNTTNSITVETSGRNINSFNYYIKESEEGEYELKGNNTTGEYAYLDLEQDKTYYIKIEAVNNNGTDVKEYTKTTGTVTAGTEEGAIVFSNVTWNPSTHTASISLSTNTDYTIQYKVSGKITTWTAGTTVSGLVHSDTVYARLFDGTNGGSSASLTIEDRINPNITLTQGVVTSNNIQINASAEDNQSGMADAPVYNFYIKKKSEDNSSYVLKQNNTSSLCTFTELEQDIDYVIKVTTQDLAENIGEQTIEVKTGVVAIATGNITCSTPVWSNKKASVLLSTALTGYTIQYKVNSGSWTTGTTVSNLVHGDTVYARLFDGTNGGSSASFNIQDSEAPTVTLTQGTVTSNSIAVSAVAIDNKSGMSVSPIYNFYIKQKSEQDSAYQLKQNNSTTICNFTELSSGITYVVKVAVADVAGNIGVETLEVTTKVVVTGVSLTSNKLVLTGGNVPEISNVSATVSPSNAENKTVQWTSSNKNVATVDQTGKVTAGNQIGSTVITATSTDGTNKSGSIEINVNKIREYFIKDGDVLTTASFGTPQFVYEGYAYATPPTSNTFGQDNYYASPLTALLYNKSAFDTAKNANKFYFRKVNNYLNIHNEMNGGNDGIGIILERGNDSIPIGNLNVDFSMESGSATANWAFVHSSHDASIGISEVSSTVQGLGNAERVWRRNTTENSNLATQYSTGNYNVPCAITTNSIPALVVCGLYSGFSGVNIRNYYFEYGDVNIETPVTISLDGQGATYQNMTSVYYKNSEIENNYYSNYMCSNKITSITVPTKTGYTFDGYYTGTNGSGTQYINASGEFVNNLHSAISADTTLYAKWIDRINTVTLDNQSATSAGTTAVYYRYGINAYYSNLACTSQITSITVPTKTGCTFGGYYTGKNGSGTQYINASGQFVNNLYNYSSNITLYAKWAHSIYAKLYTDGTLGLSSTDITISGKTVSKNYGDVGEKTWQDLDGADSNVYGTWLADRYEIQTVIIIDRIYPESMTHWFFHCTNLKSIQNISNIDTKYVTNLSSLFYECCSLETALDLRSFDTSNVYSMRSMFAGCSKVPSIDVSSFDTSKVTNMLGMFNRCYSLSSINLSNFNTSNVTNMSCFINGTKIGILDLSNFDTSNVTDMSYMLQGESLRTIFVGSRWSTSNVSKSEGMFLGCKNLVGGSGTTYDSNHIDATYAHVDGGLSNPGYFTRKQ